MGHGEEKGRGGTLESEPWKPHGLALLDYCNGATSASILVQADNGEEERVPIHVFFRDPSEFSALEGAALDLCRGRVLDVGAGAGCHSLVLQDRKLSVCAIDVAPEAVEVMRKRGVIDARCADIFSFEAEPFDTLLLMMNGVGLVGNLFGLRRFLRKAHRLLKTEGQILLDSYDPGWTGDPGGCEAQDAPLRGGQSLGEMRFQLEYLGRKGPPLEWLFLDSRTLAEEAGKAGWSCEVIWQEEEGHYLARLTPL